MPAQDGVRGTQRCHRCQQLATEHLPFRGQATALVVVESKATAAEFLAEDGVLGAQVVDDQLLFTVGVPGDDTRQQVPRLQSEFHDEPTTIPGEEPTITSCRGGVNRPNSGRTTATQVQLQELLARRRGFFTIRDEQQRQATEGKHPRGVP